MVSIVSMKGTAIFGRHFQSRPFIHWRKQWINGRKYRLLLNQSQLVEQIKTNRVSLLNCIVSNWIDSVWDLAPDLDWKSCGPLCLAVCIYVTHSYTLNDQYILTNSKNMRQKFVITHWRIVCLFALIGQVAPDFRFQPGLMWRWCKRVVNNKLQLSCNQMNSTDS